MCRGKLGVVLSQEGRRIRCSEVLTLLLELAVVLCVPQRGDQLTVMGNELAMRAAHRLHDGDWAKEIMSLPASKNSKNGLNPATLLIAVEVLAETGRLEEARGLLKVRKAC